MPHGVWGHPPPPVYLSPWGRSVCSASWSTPHLHRGSAILNISIAEEITPALAQQLRERDITVIGFQPGLEDAAADEGVADLISLLERRRYRPTRQAVLCPLFGVATRCPPTAGWVFWAGQASVTSSTGCS